MDSIYSKPDSSTLAWLRFTVNQIQARLHGLDLPYISFTQACMAPIYRKSASCRLAWTRYTVYQSQTGLHGSDIQYISPEQACMAPIYSISAPSRLAWPDILYIKRHGLPSKKKSPEQWTYHPCPRDFFMRSTVGAAYRRPPPLPPWRGGRLPRAAGSV